MRMREKIRRKDSEKKEKPKQKGEKDRMKEQENKSRSHNNTKTRETFSCIVLVFLCIEIRWGKFRRKCQNWRLSNSKKKSVRRFCSLFTLLFFSISLNETQLPKEFQQFIGNDHTKTQQLLQKMALHFGKLLFLMTFWKEREFHWRFVFFSFDFGVFVYWNVFSRKNIRVEWTDGFPNSYSSNAFRMFLLFWFLHRTTQASFLGGEISADFLQSTFLILSLTLRNLCF